MVKKTNTVCTVACILALFNVLFVPIFDVWGGLFPDNVNYTFTDVIEMVAKDADSAFDRWVVIFTMKIFISTVIALALALFRQYGATKVVAGIGLLLVVIDVGRYADQVEYDELADLFDDNTSLSIGIWVAIVLFAVILFSRTKKRDSSTVMNGGGIVVQSLGPVDPPTIPPTTATSPESITIPIVDISKSEESPKVSETPLTSETLTKCPRCESQLDGGEKFCATCGHKLVP